MKTPTVPIKMSRLIALASQALGTLEEIRPQAKATTELREVLEDYWEFSERQLDTASEKIFDALMEQK